MGSAYPKEKCFKSIMTLSSDLAVYYMNSILVTHAFGPQNRGDHELLEKLLFILKKKYGESASLSVFTSHPELSKKAIKGVHFLKSPFFKPEGLLGWLLFIFDLPIWFLSMHFSPLSRMLSGHRRECFNVAKGSTHIYMCPGGYLYSNGGSYYINIVNAKVYTLKNKLKVASPMSIGPFDNGFDQFLCKKLLRNFDKVYVRESYSHKLASNMGVLSLLMPDLAWLADEKAKNIIDESWKGRYVGTVIDWSYPKCIDIDVMKDRYLEEFVAAASYVYSKTGKPLIIYNQVGDGEGKSNDEVLIKRIVDRASGAAVFDSTAMTPAVLKARMRECEGVMASRFHSALFAIQAKVPLIVICYQPKATYILSDVGLSQIGREIETFEGEEAAASLIEYTKNKEFWVDLFSGVSRMAEKRIYGEFLGEHFD